MAWTMEQMPDMTGKVVIVTGANSGLGYETSRMFAAKNATVIMACRTTAKGDDAAQQIRTEFPQARLTVMALDLANLASVREFVKTFTAQHDRLDVLVNNAGVMALPERRATADGFEMQMGTNHFGHFALTGLLMDVLCNTPGARVISVSSGVHRMGKIDFENLNSEKSYGKWRAYGASKLANLLFIKELQRRLAAAGVDAQAMAAHPGYSATNLQQHSGLFSFLNNYLAQDMRMGALPTMYAATVDTLAGGSYVGPDGFMEMRGYPKVVGASKAANDPDVARRLWDESEKLTGVTYQL